MLLFAHGIVGRADLPIPVTLFAAACAAVLVVSFVALALGWSQPRLATLPEKRLFGLPRAVEVLLGALGVFVFFVTVYAGLFGSERPDDQPRADDGLRRLLGRRPVRLAALRRRLPAAEPVAGDRPRRRLGRATAWARCPSRWTYPERLGRWPAAAGLFAFAICELCWAKAGEPGPLALLMLVYLVVMLVGMSLYGVEPWVRNADAFGVLFSLIASLAPIGRDDDGRLVLRVPFTGAAKLAPTAGTVALLVTAVGSTAFDGAREGALFNGIAQDLQRFFADLGISLSARARARLRRRAALAVAIVGAIYALGMAGMKPTAKAPTRRALARAFGHTLAPIAAGYLVAHYFSLLAYSGQGLWRLASDPLGDGSDLFGGAGSEIDYGVVSATGIWYVQVGALVVGHVAALVLAHDRALELYGSAVRPRAPRSSCWC